MRSILRICRSADPYLPVPIRSISARHHEGRCKEARATLQCNPPPPLAHSLARECGFSLDSFRARHVAAVLSRIQSVSSRSRARQSVSQSVISRSHPALAAPKPNRSKHRGDPLGGWDKQSISARDVHGRLFPVREHQYTSRFSWTRACNRCVSFPQSWLSKLESRYFWMKFGSVASMYARSLARISKRNHGVR